MSEKVIDLIKGASPLTAGAGPLIKMQSREAQDVIAPGTAKGTDKGDTPYRQAILDLINDAGTVAIYAVGRPNPRMAGVGPQAQYAQSIRCDGVAYQFTTKFDYVAYDDEYNWIVELNGVPLTYAAAPAAADEFTVNNDGGKLQVEIGDGTAAQIPLGEIAVFQASSLKQTLLSDALNENVQKVVNPHDYVYAVAAGPANVTRATLLPYYR